MKIILASKSGVRKKILDKYKIDNEVMVSSVDEDEVKESLLAEGANPLTISKNLAEIKSIKVSSKNPDRLVLGADSVISLNGELINKPKNRAEAFSILKKLNNSIHYLISSVCISKNGAMIWNYTDQSELKMKNINDVTLTQYLDKIKNFVTPLHLSSKRNYLERMNDNKVECMNIAKKYAYDYWDGDRKYGYGGYKYIEGWWEPVAQKLIDTYNLVSGSKILDVGCGKGFLLYEIHKKNPNIIIQGFDISNYAIQNSKEEIKMYLSEFDARKMFPYKNNEFDLVISLGTLHNLRLQELKQTVTEIERVGSNGYIMLESFRNNKELFNLQCWALTCETFFDTETWISFYESVGYTGDYEFIYFE